MSSVTSLIAAAYEARRARRPEQAYRAMAEAAATARRGASSDELVAALMGLAQLERDLGRREDAVPLYEEAVALCRAGGDPLRLAHTVRHLGEVHHEAGRLDAAERCLVEAVELYRAAGDARPLDVANAVRPLAILRAETGDVETAGWLWREARDTYSRLGIDAGVAEADDWLSRLG